MKYKFLKIVEREYPIGMTFTNTTWIYWFLSWFKVPIDYLITEWYIEEVIEKPKTLKDLKEWDKIFYIDECDNITSINNYDFNFHTCDFSTYEQAKRELKFRQAKRKIEDWIEENWDWKLQITFNCDETDNLLKATKELHNEILYLTNFYNNV